MLLLIETSPTKFLNQLLLCLGGCDNFRIFQAMGFRQTLQSPLVDLGMQRVPLEEQGGRRQLNAMAVRGVDMEPSVAYHGRVMGGANKIATATCIGSAQWQRMSSYDADLGQRAFCGTRVFYCKRVSFSRLQLHPRDLRIFACAWASAFAWASTYIGIARALTSQWGWEHIHRIASHGDRMGMTWMSQGQLFRLPSHPRFPGTKNETIFLTQGVARPDHDIQIVGSSPPRCVFTQIILRHLYLEGYVSMLC